MLKNKLTYAEVRELCAALSRAVAINADKLHVACKKATNDCDDAYLHDYRTLLRNIETYMKVIDENDLICRKAKGRVLIILSYNEPLILSTDPVMLALITGNEVTVRPSSASAEVFTLIWSEAMSIVPWLKDRLTVIDSDKLTAVSLIPAMQAVYFFGSQRVAEKIAAECARHLVEFWPETEGCDFAIYTETAKIQPPKFASYVIDESFSHGGQVCQRIQGVFVHASKYSEVVKSIKKEHANRLRSAQGEYQHRRPSDVQIAERSRYASLLKLEPTADYVHNGIDNMPSIITDISYQSDLCQKAFFIPTLWIIPYQSNDEIVNIMAQRPLQFGCNLWTKSDHLKRMITERTRYTRITLNTDHLRIREDEGWGGSQPTSYGGYIKWVNRFTNSFAVVTN